MSETPIDECEMEQRAIRDRVTKKAMSDENPAWVIAWALLQIGSGIDDVGNQLYAISQALPSDGT